MKTEVLVENGGTVVIGGIYQQTINNSTSKVPFLGDVPVLGRLFRNDYKNDAKSELLIFITPVWSKTSWSTADRGDPYQGA